MHQTLTDLRRQLGSAYRVQIDAEPDRRKRPVIVTVRWRCGCSAGGTHLRALLAAPCRAHRSAAEGERPRGGGIPLLRTLISRS